MDRITRKELKSDKFALEVGHAATFFEEHRDVVFRYAAIAAGVLVLALAIGWYTRHQHTVRQEALAQALLVQEAPVGDANPNAPISFPTEQAKHQEAVKKFTELATKYSGNAEGQVAQYYLGMMAVDEGKMPDAEKYFQQVAQGGDSNYASLGKLALAQILGGSSRVSEAEKMLRGLIDSPTAFVSKDQATVALARILAPTRPADARKLLEPMRTQPGVVGQLAISMYGEIPAQ